MIDLHAHSTASDGTDAPGQLIRRAATAGVATLAITDHDTTAGWDPAVSEVLSLTSRFTLLRGTEFSCQHRDAAGQTTHLHLLGYLYDPAFLPLQLARQELRAARLGRGRVIVDNLVAAGYPITWDRVEHWADGGAVGRPHIGQALVEAGVVPSVTEAFSKLLADDSQYYVAKRDLEAIKAIALIRQAGGVPVIAHPWARRRGAVLSEPALVELIESGLLGLEIDHPDQGPADRARLREIAAEWTLIRTGSSDYHGTNKPTSIGAETTSEGELERLIESATGLDPVRAGRGQASSRLGR